MKLESVSIYNLRSIQKLEKINLSSGFDTFIGQNDSGKSTFLYALKNFFDFKEGNFNFENIDSKENDFSHQPLSHKYDNGLDVVNENEIGVLCEFIIEDEENFVKRSDLLDYAENNSLTILKKVSRGNIYNKKQFQYYVLRKMFIDDENFNKLGSLSEKELIKLMEKYPGSNEYLKNINESGKPENIERRKALFAFAKKNIEFIYDFTEFNFKKEPDDIWPTFELIDSNGDIDGSNKIVDGIFNEISKKIVDNYKTENASYKLLLDNIEEGFRKVADKICEYAKLNYIRNLESVTAFPNINIKAGKELLIKRIGQKAPSHWNCQGDGTKRRLMVSILQCGKILKELGSSETEKQDKEYERLKIWAFDEPELHLHPGAQRDLFVSLKTFQTEGYQVICSTHSTIFVDNVNLLSNHLLDLDENLNTIEIKKDESIQDLIKNNLGIKNSDIFYSNAFIIVEGQTEEIALPIIYAHLSDSSLENKGIKIICSEGCDSSFEKINAYIENFTNAIGCLDKDVEVKAGFKGLIEKGLIKLIGKKCDFEDSFSDDVWVAILEENFVIEGFTWSKEVIEDLRGKIEIQSANKKLLKLIQNKYEKEYMERNSGNTDFPQKIDNKPKIGRLLAEKAIELNKIPEEINSMFEYVNTKLLNESQIQS